MATTTTAGDVRNHATAYFDGWNTGDEEALRALFAPGVTFRGPMGTVHGPDECVAGLLGMRRAFLDEVAVEHLLVTGDEAVTWFEMRTRLPGVEPFPVVNRMHVGPDGIDRIRVVFDPRELLAALGG
ncbi:nuclear transport factor 2 family protein [Kineococcus endophyticus]|uniref:Nuclear transport factor 2 family protein n=1 Tax=Kineococcus endophyticus TaxID=1181883 RepID=A0ABV3P276_9ACTN